MLTRFIYYFLALFFFVFLLYFNFRANNNTAVLVPVNLLDKSGFDSVTILAIKNFSDKIAHLGSGFLLCAIIFFFDRSRKESRVPSLNLSGFLKWSGFLIAFFCFLEFSQLAYRKAFCGVDYSCRSVYFSWLDVVSSFGGAILALALIMIIQSRSSGQIKN